MKNMYIYVITIVASFIFICVDIITDNCSGGIMTGIGCSGISAAVMAIFIDRNTIKVERKRKGNIKKMYFHDFESLITKLIGELIWFDEMIEDNIFNWNLDDDMYKGLNFEIYATKISKGRTISYNDAIECLDSISNKYNLDELVS